MGDLWAPASVERGSIRPAHRVLRFHLLTALWYCRHCSRLHPTQIELYLYSTLFHRLTQNLALLFGIFRNSVSFSTLMASACVHEVLPPLLDSTSEQPPLFDGTTRLYTYYLCPFAQRVWITRNYKGLQDKIKLVGIDLTNRPAWYKEKVYPENKVPSLEHNGKVMGESLDLIKYVDTNFEGPALLPEDSAKRQFAEELFSYADTLNKCVFPSFKAGPTKETGDAFDYLETALGKFNDGPFFLGQFSQADIAFAPFIERFQIFFQDVWKYDIFAGRPKLAAWFEEVNKIDAYKPTKPDPNQVLQVYKKLFLA